MDNQALTPTFRPANGGRRRLGFHHLAFFRAFIEGLPFDEIAVRYLDTGKNRKAARATLKWVIDELTAAARRQRPAVARILKIAPARLDPPREIAMPAAPAMSLEDFRVERDPDGFYSERELIELFELEVNAGIAPAVRRQAARNARLRERQIEAVRWLEGWIAEAPKAGDPLSAWREPIVADRLAKAGILTVAELVELINTRGKRWWSKVPRLGPEGAARLVTWLDMSKASIGQTVNAGALVPYEERLPTLKASRPLSFGIVPLDYLAVPDELSGSAGLNRGRSSTLSACNDLEAISAWFRSLKQKDHTLRSYRSHVERFVLWALVERSKALSSLTTDDCNAFRNFLYALDPNTRCEWPALQPREAWIGKRGTPRYSKDWRPFAGPIGVDAQNLTHSVCASMCTWLVKQGYLKTNPWNGVEQKDTRTERIKAERSLSVEQWQMAIDYLESLPRDERYFRLRFTLWFAVSTGVRLDGIAAGRLSAIQPGTQLEGGIKTWKFVVVGTRGKSHEVPLSGFLMDCLHDYLRVRGIEQSYPNWPAQAPLVATLSREFQRASEAGKPVTARAVYGLLKRFFENVADHVQGVNLADADRLRHASTHWLRHTFATLALDAGADLRELSKILNHADLRTIMEYVKANRRRRAAAIERSAMIIVNSGGQID